MIKTSSYRIVTRVRTALLILIALLIVAMLIQNFKKNFEYDENGIFIPITLVKQTKAVIDVINSGQGKSDKNYSFPCSSRQSKILSELISEKTHLPFEESELFLKQIWHSLAIQDITPSCKTFPHVIRTAFNVIDSIKINTNKTLDRSVKESFVESLSWDKKSICIIGQDQFGKFIAYGNYNNCKEEKLSIAENSEKRNFLKKQLKPIVSLANNQGILNKKENVFHITINPEINYVLNQLIACNRPECPLKIKQITEQADFISVVILDADKNDILAVGCYGEKCENSENHYLGLLKGLNVEVPPASTVKLFYSLALSQNNPQLNSELQFQIKTSGQLDQFVKKRNEWWEKISICQIGKNQVCEIPISADSFANKIGWNQFCNETPSRLCGNSKILQPLGIEKFSPPSGRFLVQSTKDGSFTPNKKLFGEYLDWQAYENIRSGIKKINNPKLLEKTSLVIQSAIGAGDNRTSSLGIAMISSGIYQASQNGRINEVSLLRLNDSPKFESMPKNSANNVLKGMQKVVMPAEKGWIGDGTASFAFTNAFGDKCVNDCPIFAKTGTVSQQDRSNAGTTLFTSVVLSNELEKKYFSKKNLRKNIAIGVIVKPQKRNKEHLASKLGMLIIKELIINE